MAVTQKDHERGVCWNILLVICVILLPPLAGMWPEAGLLRRRLSHPPPPNTLFISLLLYSHPAVFLNEKTLRSSHFWVCLLLTILVRARSRGRFISHQSELPSTQAAPRSPSQGWIAGVIYGIYEIWFSHSNGTARKPKAADVHHGEQRPVV